jgi:hypothetical protein
MLVYARVRRIVVFQSVWLLYVIKGIQTMEVLD